MQIPKPSLLVITMLAALVAQSHAAVEPASHESIGLVENNSYANSDFDQPKNGVILGKDSLGIGQSKGNVIVVTSSSAIIPLLEATTAALWLAPTART